MRLVIPCWIQRHQHPFDYRCKKSSRKGLAKQIWQHAGRFPHHVNNAEQHDHLHWHRKSLWQNQTPFHIIKGICKKSTANIRRTRTRMPALPTAIRPKWKLHSQRTWPCGQGCAANSGGTFWEVTRQFCLSLRGHTPTWPLWLHI